MINPITFKKATLTTDDETTEGVLVVANDPAITSLDEKSKIKIPKKIFVPLEEPVFYTDNDEYLDKVLKKCREKSDMLELLGVLNMSVPFIDDYFFDETSGFIVNFYQPHQSYQGFPVYVQLLDPIEWLNHWNMTIEDKNKWIKAMLDKNPPENIKNRLLLVNL